MPYHHTQWGSLILLICLAIAVIAAAILWLTGTRSMLFTLFIVGGLAVLFCALTVDISGNELRWYFGPGFWSYRLALDDIQTVAIVRNHWWNGWGIRAAPGFTLYNVSGLDAVELKLKSGEIRRIGTDDPQGLAAALNAQMQGG
jgi:hypothetical protein